VHRICKLKVRGGGGGGVLIGAKPGDGAVAVGVAKAGVTVHSPYEFPVPM
jgi:hypothetical protein